MAGKERLRLRLRKGDGFIVSNIRLLIDAAQAWIDDRVIRLGAAVAYYSLFALIPVLFLSMALASVFLDAGQVMREVEAALADLLGSEAAATIVETLVSMKEANTGLVFSLIGLGVLLFSATLLFVAWKDVVAIIFRAPRLRGARASVRRRLFGVLAVLGAGALLTLDLFFSTVVTLLERLTDSVVGDIVVTAVGSILPLLLGSIFVAVLFKYTPDVEIEWRSTWVAAAVSMVMLSVGAWAYGVYLDIYGFSSVSGALGSVFLGLALVYYGAQILLYGVEVVRISQERRSNRPKEVSRSDLT